MCDRISLMLEWDTQNMSDIFQVSRDLHRFISHRFRKLHISRYRSKLAFRDSRCRAWVVTPLISGISHRAKMILAIFHAPTLHTLHYILLYTNKSEYKRCIELEKTRTLFDHQASARSWNVTRYCSQRSLSLNSYRSIKRWLHFYFAAHIALHISAHAHILSGWRLLSVSISSLEK